MVPNSETKPTLERQDFETFIPDHCHNCQRKVVVRTAYKGSWLCDQCFPKD